MTDGGVAARRPWPTEAAEAPVQSAAVPRNRTARTAVLGVSVRRPAAGKPSSRTTTALRRRLVVGGPRRARARARSRSRSASRDDGPRRVRAGGRRGGAAPVPGRGRARRRAVPRRVRAGSTASSTPARTPSASREENEALRQQVDPEPVRSQRERPAQGAARVPRRPALPRRLHGLAAAVIARPAGRVRAGDRRRGRVATTASPSTPRSSRRTGSSAASRRV